MAQIRALRESAEHPLGPVLVRHDGAAAAGRARAGAALAGAIGVFAVALMLEAPATGFGAHEQLYPAPCPMPILLGIPCPTCGMTTAFVHLAHGRPLASFHAQPAGFCIAVGLVFAAALAGEGVITGRPRVINWYRVSPVRFAITAGLILLAGWVYKLVAWRAGG